MPGREKQRSDDDEGEKDLFGELPQPDEDDIDESGKAKRHTDHRLQTLLTSEGLQKRLLSMYYDAKTFEEEQGVNILYLAIGMLKWFEDKNSDIERRAPLILVPVSLERGNATERFKLRWRSEECAANLSLQAKIKDVAGLIIPDLPQDDDLDIAAYMQEVTKVISGQDRFEVIENDMVLGFFSFAKFLMYRDLDAANWPEENKLDGHPLITGLMGDGFSSPENMIGEDDHVDEHLTPAQMMHVVDADSSQTLAIEEVRRGRNLVNPSYVEGGANVLLAESSALLGFLETHNLEIVWTLLAEKMVLGEFGDQRKKRCMSSFSGAYYFESENNITGNIEEISLR